MKKLLFILLVLSFLVSLLLTATTSQAFTHLDDLTLSTDRTAQTKADVASFSCNDVSDVPVIECEALVELYMSTNGVEWENEKDCSKIDCWLVSTKVNDWFGITVDINTNHVTYIELNGNGLSGEIPETISDLQYLIELCLTGNNVYGTLPESISQMTSLEKLSLDYNSLSGSIPESLSLLTKLTKISLGHNQLSGIIPAALGGLPALQKLEFHDNKISGELPDSLGQLTSLVNFLINDNPIEGKIPLSYTNLTNLDYFYFYSTELCEPTTPKFLEWKTSVGEWNGTGLICMDYYCFIPIITR